MHCIGESGLGPTRYKERGHNLYLLMGGADCVYRKWWNCLEPSSQLATTATLQNQIHLPTVFLNV